MQGAEWRKVGSRPRPSSSNSLANVLVFALRNTRLAAVKILFIGDIVGEPGRRAVKTLVPMLRVQHRLDAVVANG
jgi:hypothetical protein